MEILRFGLLGLGTGAIYAMVASGLVVVYRGSGVVNFAQGAFVMVGAYAYLQFAVNFGWPTFAALCAATAFCGVVGAAVHLIVLRPMRRSSPLARVIATLGLLVLAQSIAVLHYGLSVRSVPSALPTRGVQVLPHTLIGLDRIFIFLIGACLTAVLWARTATHRSAAQPQPSPRTRSPRPAWATRRTGSRRSTGQSGRPWPAWPER